MQVQEKTELLLKLKMLKQLESFALYRQNLQLDLSQGSISQKNIQNCGKSLKALRTTVQNLEGLYFDDICVRY